MHIAIQFLFNFSLKFRINNVAASQPKKNTTVLCNSLRLIKNLSLMDIVFIPVPVRYGILYTVTSSAHVQCSFFILIINITPVRGRYYVYILQYYMFKWRKHMNKDMRTNVVAVDPDAFFIISLSIIQCNCIIFYHDTIAK